MRHSTSEDDDVHPNTPVVDEFVVASAVRLVRSEAGSSGIGSEQNATGDEAVIAVRQPESHRHAHMGEHTTDPWPEQSIVWPPRQAESNGSAHSELALSPLPATQSLNCADYLNEHH